MVAHSSIRKCLTSKILVPVRGKYKRTGMKRFHTYSWLWECYNYNPGQNVWDTLPYAKFLQYLLPPPSPLCNVGRLFNKPFLMNNIAWGEGVVVEFDPKNVCFNVKNDQWLRHCILQECPT